MQIIPAGTSFLSSTCNFTIKKGETRSNLIILKTLIQNNTVNFWKYFLTQSCHFYCLSFKKI